MSAGALRVLRPRLGCEQAEVLALVCVFSAKSGAMDDFDECAR
jgi:hypothetical protein